MSVELKTMKPIDQLKDMVNTVKDMKEAVAGLFGIDEEKKILENEIALQTSQQEIKELQHDTEKEKMILVLSQYCKALLTPEEIKSLDNMFL